MAERPEFQQPISPPTEGLTPEEDVELVVLLKKSVGRISTPVFTEIARIIPQPIVEVVIFRRNEDVLETLLIPRPEDDIVWPGMYHTPGVALRAADFRRDDQEPLNGAFERIQRGELKSNFLYPPIFTGVMNVVGERGGGVSQVFVTGLPEDSSQPDHIWYPVDLLPQNPKFIQSQMRHVRLAAAFFEMLGNNS